MASEQDTGLEALLLTDSNSLDFAELLEVRNKRGHGVVAETSRVDRAGHKVVAQGVGLDERGEADRVAKVVHVLAAGQRRARRGLDGDDTEALGSLLAETLAEEGEAEAGKVGASTGAADEAV